LKEKGLMANAGKAMDATIGRAPVQRNIAAENDKIKKRRIYRRMGNQP